MYHRLSWGGAPAVAPPRVKILRLLKLRVAGYFLIAKSCGHLVSLADIKISMAPAHRVGEVLHENSPK